MQGLPSLRLGRNKVRCDQGEHADADHEILGLLSRGDDTPADKLACQIPSAMHWGTTKLIWLIHVKLHITHA